MPRIVAVLLGLALFGAAGNLTALRADGEKKTEAASLAGRFTLTSGKKNGTPIDDAVKQGRYTITADTITIEGGDIKFVIGYKLDTSKKPVRIDMEILEGPEGTKGAKAEGIIELKGDVLRLAYATEKGQRPKGFEGKEGFYFELKKQK